MKKTLALLLAFLMMFAALQAVAEAPIPDYEELIVGSTSAMSGSFFTDLWGSNTTDIDVRTLLHGYNLVEWKSETSSFGIDESVLSGIVVTLDDYNNRVYTIALYNDLYYSDGTPITAWDYAFSMLLTTSPQMAEIGAAASGADYILGIDEYRAGETNVLAGVHVENDYQLSITVKEAYLPFFYEMALLDCTPYPISVIAPGCEVADDGNGVYIRNKEAEFTAELLNKTILDPETGYRSHPSVTSGPYVLTSYDAANSVATFEINPYYKGNSDGELPLIPKLTVKHVTNETLVDQLASGEIDMVNKCVNAQTLDEGMALADQGLVSVSNYARSGQSFISFNCERPGVSEASVRKAIAYCFDKDAFINAYVRNYGLRVDGYYGIGQWMYQLASGTMEAPIGEAPAGADRASVNEYNKQKREWEELNMDDVRVYNLDLNAAKRVLERDGWVKDQDGKNYNANQEDIRSKVIDGELVSLNLKLYYPEGNAAGEQLGATLVDNLKKVGINLTVEAKPFNELLKIYYRQQERDCDMIYMATNFASVFDPAATFAPADAYQGVNNRTGIADEKLYELAVEMRMTEPGDILEYCQKWVAFQERYAEVLPTLGVYSNVYFDFYTPTLHNYVPGAEPSWADAIIGAYLSDAEIVEEETGEDDVVFLD